MELLLEISTNELCNDERHTFETHGRLPIPNLQKCGCGKVTWSEAVEAARQKLFENIE